MSMSQVDTRETHRQAMTHRGASFSKKVRWQENETIEWTITESCYHNVDQIQNKTDSHKISVFITISCVNIIEFSFFFMDDISQGANITKLKRNLRK